MCLQIVPIFGVSSIDGVGVAVSSNPASDIISESPSKSVNTLSSVGISFIAGIEYSTSSNCRMYRDNNRQDKIKNCFCLDFEYSPLRYPVEVIQPEGCHSNHDQILGGTARMVLSRCSFLL